MEDIKFEIKETVGVISESAKGWRKELNLITWNDKEAKMILGNGMRNIRRWVKELLCL